MAITPRSKGLGNIGSIVNRQRMASPTRPQIAAPKPVAPKSTVNPFAGGKTTTAAQRQAMTPFRSATKPVAKVNPLDMQPAMPVTPPQVAPQPFNPNPTPGQIGQPGLPYFPGGGDYMPEPTPGQIGQPGLPYFPFGGDFNPEPMPGGGIFGGIMPMDNQAPMFNNQIGPSFNVGGATMGRFADFNPTMDFGGLQTGQQLTQIGQQGLGQMFGNPNPMTSDYDQLEDSAFNTNPSGSLFSGGGFAGK